MVMIAATVIELAIGQNPIFFDSDCFQNISEYEITILVFNIFACIVPLICMCCKKYIIFTNIMICISGLFFLKSVWTFKIFTEYFSNQISINSDCHLSNTFYNQLGIINIEIFLSVVNIILVFAMVFFLVCTKVYITRRGYLGRSCVTENKTRYGEIKTDTFVNNSYSDNVAVVRTSDMDRILCFVISSGMMLVGTHHVMCYVNNNVSEYTSFYNDTVSDLETYALFSTVVNYMCGSLLLILMCNTKNICIEKIPGAVCIFYLMCMIVGVVLNHTLKNMFDVYENKSDINSAYNIYSVAQFDAVVVFIILSVPFAFANFSPIYIIDTESNRDTDNILTAELLDEYGDDNSVMEQAIIIENN